MVGYKLINKIKTCSDRSIERYEPCLVAKGFTQEYEIDYEETFAPIARISSVRALLAVLLLVNRTFFRWMSKMHSLMGI